VSAARDYAGVPDLIAEQAEAEAREHFWAYRQHMHPGMLKGWWQETVSDEFERFHCDLRDGLRPKLMLVAPPQHGKSEMVSDLIAYLAGRLPDLKKIFTSYSEDLGLRTNLYLQRQIDTPRYAGVFPRTRLGGLGRAQHRVKRTDYLLEYVGHAGSFVNTTVNGQITGQGLDIGFIDDPIKGREAAHSKTIRDKAWGWLVDDFFTRFSKDAGMVITTTRWHMDDPAGRFLEKFPETRLLRWPAIATEDEPCRLRGEPLFPEHKPLAFLLERQRAMTQASWEALYQGRPIVEGGGMFPVARFQTAASRPALVDIRRSVRYWDKAGTAGGGAFSVGVRMDLTVDGRFVVSDVRRGQWGALDRETQIRQACELDNAVMRTETWVEQEPGSGGKESAEATVRMLKGFIVRADRVTGSKESRAEPYAAQVEGKNVSLVAADWNGDFIDEHASFPSGKRKDQVDAAGGAFAKLSAKGSYDSSYSWL
jgi:predicted phage terminase large subunit-like protein